MKKIKALMPEAYDFNGKLPLKQAIPLGLQHGRSRDAVGPYGGQLDVRASGGKRRRQLTAKTAALPVND